MKSKNNDNIFLNYNETEIDGFQVFTPNVPLEKEKNKYGNLINPFEMKNSDDFLNSWKTLEALEESKEEKEIFDNLWDYILKLNKNNIMDYSLINELLRFLGDDILIQRFLFMLFTLIDNSLDDYIKDENKFFIAKNNLIYFMFILTNLRNNEKFNNIFVKEKIEYLTLILTKIQKIKNLKDKDYFNNILNKLFSTEYIHLGLNLFLPNNTQKQEDNIINNKTEENIINNNYKSNIYKTLNDFYKAQKNIDINYELQKEKYIKVIESIFDFEGNFLNYKKNTKLDYIEQFMEQIELAKNIILIVFSKEKYQYLNNDNVYYEYEFLDKLIKKNISETKEIHEDKYKNLFRRDTVSNNIIKYIFFLFGNSMIIESLIKPLNTLLNIIGLNNDFEIILFEGNSLNSERNITKDEFNIIFDKILDKLNETIPFFLRVFLKMVYDNVVNEYPNIKKDDYSPLSSLLFFCYLSNPRIQSIYEIYPDKYLLIKSIYRLIYNASFNIKFKEEDDLNIFNDEIEKYYDKINEFYENNVINIEINEENKKYLKNLFDEIGVEYPIFIFYLCCDYIYDLDKDINIDNDEEI